MYKPTMQREVAIDWIYKGRRIVYFFSSPDAKLAFADFGDIHPSGHTDQYCLQVDPRFEFDEVVLYIENYGKEV